MASALKYATSWIWGAENAVAEDGNAASTTDGDENSAATKMQARFRGQKSRRNMPTAGSTSASGAAGDSASASASVPEVVVHVGTPAKNRRNSLTGQRETDIELEVDEDLRRKQEGKLVIQMISGKDLINCDTETKTGISDPFCLVKVPGRRRFRTKVKMNTLNPVWDETLIVKGTLDSFLADKMRIKVYDHDYLTLNDPMGNVTVSLEALLRQTKLHFDDIPLDGVAHGSIKFKVKFEQESISYAFPSPVAQSAHEAINTKAPDDATCMERFRDSVLHALDNWLLFKLLTGLFIAGVVSWIGFLVVLFPMQLKMVPWTSLGWSEEYTKKWWVYTNGVITCLFSYQNGMTIPWRLSLMWHLLNPNRSSEVGLDFYGRPTESMFFHIPRKPRMIITTFLILAVVFHFISQAMRLIFTTYETAESPPGSLWITLTFLPSILSAIAAGILQAKELKKIQAANSVRFPPSSLERAVTNGRKRWKQGEVGCCGALTSTMAEFRELEKTAATAETSTPSDAANYSSNYSPNPSPTQKKGGGDVQLTNLAEAASPA